MSGQSGISAVDQILRNVDIAGIQDERALEFIRLLLNLIESLTADLRKAQAEILYLREQLNRRKGGGGKPDQPKDTAGAQPQSSEKERAETKQRTRRSKLDRIRIDREEVLKLYLLNKSGRLRGSPRRTEAHRFSSLFDQIRQGGHLSGSADPVADVLKEVHSRFSGCAQQRFHRVPGPGAGQRARTVAHHSFFLTRVRASSSAGLLCRGTSGCSSTNPARIAAEIGQYVRYCEINRIKLTRNPGCQRHPKAFAAPKRN